MAFEIFTNKSLIIIYREYSIQEIGSEKLGSWLLHPWNATSFAFRSSSVNQKPVRQNLWIALRTMKSGRNNTYIKNSAIASAAWDAESRNLATRSVWRVPETFLRRIPMVANTARGSDVFIVIASSRWHIRSFVRSFRRGVVGWDGFARTIRLVVPRIGVCSAEDVSCHAIPFVRASGDRGANR